mmetsp:Transcript_143554/g.400146  ORF Transcript_143554/g.400146 Transcript_143554/m.400146 type:complete len:203 (-) Transcript_143554:212-820(-)
MHIHEAGGDLAYSEAHTDAALVCSKAAETRLNPVTAELPHVRCQRFVNINEDGQASQPKNADPYKLTRAAPEGTSDSSLDSSQALWIAVLAADNVGRLELDKLLHTYNENVTNSPRLQPPIDVICLGNLVAVQVPRAHPYLQWSRQADEHRERPAQQCHWLPCGLQGCEAVAFALAVLATDGEDVGNLAEIAGGANPAGVLL